MKRREPRPGWGWETFYDVYQAMRRHLGGAGGQLTLREHDDMGEPACELRWITRARGQSYGFTADVTERQLTFTPAEELGRMLAFKAKDRLRAQVLKGVRAPA